MSASIDDSESVDAFLERIASLKERRDREDGERTRKLEEEILQGRKDRQARRAGEHINPVFTVRKWTEHMQCASQSERDPYHHPKALLPSASSPEPMRHLPEPCLSILQ